MGAWGGICGWRPKGKNGPMKTIARSPKQTLLNSIREKDQKLRRKKKHIKMDTSGKGSATGK